jgi:tRNA A37 threonylcarbamoyladenosine dehydratase
MKNGEEITQNLRFGGIERLYGKEAFNKISSSHILVVGVGGVGSWVLEALARTGVGTLSFVDLDEICVTNTNRQIHALSSTVGKSKVEVMKERLFQINPDIKLNVFNDFYTEKTADLILSHDYDYVVDAIDSLQFKIHLCLECKKRKLPFLMMGGAAGKRDPTLIKVQDLSETIQDSLLFRVRKKLRMEYGYPKAPASKKERVKKMKVDCVSSSEQAMYPMSDGSVCLAPESGSNLKLDCQSGMGTATFLTGSFAFIASAFVIKKIIS